MRIEKRLRMIIFFAIIILANFCFADKASATYYQPSGSWTSTNLLAGEGVVVSINSFIYNLSAKPAGSGATIQFSQDNVNWYNSLNVPNGTDTLATGVNNTINLSGLGWSGANFYYKVAFTSTLDWTGTPVLDDISLTYTTNSAPASPSFPLQYKSDGITLIANQGTTSETSVKLKASVTDADNPEVINLFFETALHDGAFASPATPTTGTSCTSGTEWSSCANKIWYVASGSGDYTSTPYTGTTTVAGLNNDGYKWQVKVPEMKLLGE